MCAAVHEAAVAEEERLHHLKDLACRDALGKGLPGCVVPAKHKASATGESGSPDAEGATAPVNSQAQGPSQANRLWREAHAPAEGITISGERTEGASGGRPSCR